MGKRGKKGKSKPCNPVATEPWKNRRKTIKEIKEKQHNEREFNKLMGLRWF